MNQLLEEIQSNLAVIEEGFFINRNLKILPKIPKTITVNDISYTRVLVMKAYVVAIKSTIKYIPDTLEFGNPVFASDTPEGIVERYNRDGFGYKVANAVKKHSGELIKHVQKRLSKKIVDKYISNIEIDSFQLNPDKGEVTSFISNADDFEDGPNFEVVFKLSGSNISIVRTMKF